MSVRILIVGRHQDRLDRTTAILERVGHIVTGTLDDGVAIDLVGSSQFDALLIDREVSPQDRRYVTTQSREADPDTRVVVVESPEAVLTRLRHAGLAI